MRISDWSSDVCSSDLRLGFWTPAFAGEQCTLGCAPPNPRTPARRSCRRASNDNRGRTAPRSPAATRRRSRRDRRSEEHTSELQSLMRISYAVFCLKKTKTYTFLSSHVIEEGLSSQ